MISTIPGPGSFSGPSWHQNICWNTRGSWENGNASDDGGWSMGAPGRGSGWNGTGKVEGNWQAAVKGGATALNCVQSSLPRVGDVNQSKEWPIVGRNGGKSNSNTLGWANSEENINASISDNNWGMPQDVVGPAGGKHLDGEMTFELDPLNLEPGKDDAFYTDMNWTAEELELKHTPTATLTSPRHDEMCFRRSPKVPQVGDIIATVENKGVAETGYIPFGNPLKQVHSSDRRWTSKDSVSSTGSSVSSIQSPQRNNMGGRMFQGKLGNPHSKLSTSNRGDKNGGNYNRTGGKPKNIGLFASDNVEKEPTGWGDLPSPNADLVDNGTSDWARPMARERQRMLIKSQLDGINGWDTGPTSHWDDKFDKNAGWAELSRQTGQHSNEDNEGWCTVNGKPSKNEAFHHQVQTLIEMGFKKEDCERVLKTNNCNLEHALGDLLALTCTEELNITTTNSDLTKLQSVTTTTAASANLLVKNATATTQLPVSSLSTVVPGATPTTSGNVWTSKSTSGVTMPLSTSNGSLSVSQALSSTAQTLPLPQGQFNPQMFQPPVIPPKLLNEISANSSSVGQQKQQLLSHLKLVNYHLAFLTKMQQTLFQKLSIFNDTSALMSGLPPPLVQQQKQEVLLQLQQVNTMIVIYSQQSVLLKQLSSGSNASSSSGSKTSPKVSKAGVTANPDSSSSDKEINDSTEQKLEQEAEEKDKDVENVSTNENEPTSDTPNETIQSSNEVSVDELQKSVTDKVPEEVNELQEEEKTVEEDPAAAAIDTVATKENPQPPENSETSLPSTATSVVASTAQPITSTAISSVTTYDDDNFPPEFQPGKLWVPRSQATESSQTFTTSKPNGVQSHNSSTTKSLSNATLNSIKPVQAQMKSTNKFSPHFTMPQNSPAKVGMPPAGIAPITQTPVRPGMPPPPMGNKFTPSTRQIQNSINNLMFAQLGNNAAAAAAARKGTFPAPNIPGGFPRPGKKNLPMAQFPPPFLGGNNYGSFPSLPQPAMPPPPPQMGTTFPMKNAPYSPHNGMKKSSSFPGKPPGMIPPVMPPQQPSLYNYQQPGVNKAGRPMPVGSGNFHGAGTIPANGSGMRQQMGLWGDASKFGGLESSRPPLQQQLRPPPAALSGAVDQQLTMPLSFGESLWSDNPNSPVSVTSPDPTFAEWQAGKKAHIFKLPSNSPSSWLVFRNLPPQMDHTTLRELCSGFGAVQTFYMNESMQNALVRYSHPTEATEAKIKLERANYNGISMIVDFASDSDIGEFIDSMSPRQEGSPPPLSFTAPPMNDECWEDNFKPHVSDSKWFSSTAPMNIPPNSDVSSSAAWKGGDLFAPWATQQNEPGENNITDNTNHLATSPSMSTFLPNGLL